MSEVCHERCGCFHDDRHRFLYATLGDLSLPLKYALERRRETGELGGCLVFIAPEARAFAVIGLLSTVAYVVVFLALRGFMGAQAANALSLLLTAVFNTAANRRLNLTVALSYGGRAEIAEAARRIAEEVRAGLDPAQVDERRFERFLYTSDMPDPDLLIRTSGEKRISNFLLWQCAYAELVFLDRLWPDFTRDDLESAITEYHGRDRRYGAAR